MHLEWTRAYSGCTGGVESVQLYDWQSASYPYGNFVSVSSLPITGTAEERQSIALPSHPERFIDDEGTLYVQLTATNASGASQLSLDSLRLRVE